MKKKLYIFLIIVLGLLIAATALYLYHTSSSFREGLDAGPMIQYVKVSYPTSPKYIQISQIAVYSGGQNIAAKGTTTASAPYSAESSKDNAIDGTLATRNHPSIYHSKTEEAGQFWQLDLGKEYPVDKVVYYNRKDCCSDRAKGMIIELADKNKKEVEKLTLTDQMIQSFDLEPVKEETKKTCPSGSVLNDMNTCVKVAEDDDSKPGSYNADFFKSIGGYIEEGESEDYYADLYEQYLVYMSIRGKDADDYYTFMRRLGQKDLLKYEADQFEYDSMWMRDLGRGRGGYDPYYDPYYDGRDGGLYRPRDYRRREEEYEEEEEYEDDRKGTSSYIGPAGNTVIIGRDGKRKKQKKRDRKRRDSYDSDTGTSGRGRYKRKEKCSLTTPSTKIPNADSPYSTTPVLPPGSEDKYMLKSQMVPAVDALYPGTSSSSTTTAGCLKQAPFPPCPPCERCPEPAFDCKKVPNYSSAVANTNLPRPVLADFSSFGM